MAQVYGVVWNWAHPNYPIFPVDRGVLLNSWPSMSRPCRATY